jgi:CheY-like chemotaxis protein
MIRGGADGLPGDGSLRDITVLVVDDNDDNADLFRTFLAGCAARVLVARDAFEALDHLDATASVDIILTDLSMPGLSGVELMRQVRSHALHAQIPAVAISGFPETYFADDAHYFSAFLLKPVELERLAAIVRQLVTTRRAA